MTKRPVFEFIESLHGLSKPVLCQSFDLGFFEFVLLDDLDDEVLLLRGAVPHVVLLRGSPTMTVPIAITVPITVRAWQVTNFFDAGIHAFLKKFVQPGALLLHLVEVSDFRSERDGEGVR